MDKVAENTIKKLLLKEAQIKREWIKDKFVKEFLYTEANEQLGSELDTLIPQPSIKEPVIEPVIEPELPTPPELKSVKKKNNKDKSLFVDRTQLGTNLASLEERLQKSANKLDALGEIRVADKIDQLLKILKEKSND